MIDRSHALPVTREARELGIGPGSVYYLPGPTSSALDSQTKCDTGYVRDRHGKNSILHA